MILSVKRFFAGFIICLVKCNSDIDRLMFPNYIHLLLMMIIIIFSALINRMMKTLLVALVLALMLNYGEFKAADFQV